MTLVEEVGPMKKVYVGNLGKGNVTISDIKNLFGLEDTALLKTSCSVQMMTNEQGTNCQSYAIVSVPESIHGKLLTFNETQYAGKTLEVKVVPENVSSEFGDFQSGGPPRTTQDSRPIIPSNDVEMDQNLSYGAVARDENDAQAMVYRFVELDTTTCYDCYGVPTRAQVLHALALSYGEDRTKKLKEQSGQYTGVWRIETENIHLYENTGFLEYRGEHIGTISIKREERYMNADGKIFTKKKTEKNELLLTLVGANMDMFKDVTSAMILREIVNMGVGCVKRAPTPQVHYSTDILNGNKFFVLENIKPDQYDSIPNQFEFGYRKMYINYRGKKRKCKFCSEYHGENCELKELYEKLMLERDELKKVNGGLPYKTYSDSTMRYCRQEALTSNVDAISGATTCNLINAHDIDEEEKETKHVVLIAGINEFNENYSTEEFMRILETKKERLTKLAGKKKVAILAPPEQTLFSAMHKLKDAEFRSQLNDLGKNNDNITVWENPLKEYAEDDGKHPSQEQTGQIINFLDKKLTDAFGHPYKLPSATDEIATVTRKYSGVRSLYKYGCGVCDTKVRNKFYSLCAECKNATAENEFQRKVELFVKMANEMEEIENPPLSRKRTLNDEENKRDDKRGRRSTVLHEKI